MPRISQSQRIQLWRDRLQRFSRANQTVAAFCSSEGFSVQAFYQWKRRLQFANQSTPKDSTVQPQLGSFAELAVVASPPVPIRVLLPGNVKIELGDQLEAVAVIVRTAIQTQHAIANEVDAEGETSC